MKNVLAVQIFSLSTQMNFLTAKLRINLSKYRNRFILEIDQNLSRVKAIDYNHLFLCIIHNINKGITPIMINKNTSEDELVQEFIFSTGWK